MIRSAWAIISDVRAWGADLEADIPAGRVRPTEALPAALAAEVDSRSLDIIAIFEEFYGDSLRPWSAIAAAERLIRGSPKRRTAKSRVRR